MNETDRDFCEITVRISKEIGARLEKARADWVKKHADREVEEWKNEHPGPKYWESPLGSDRYDEYCDKLRREAETKWKSRFDRELLSEALSDSLSEELNRFIKNLK